ncbi:MAG: hypothetical protein ACHQNA_02070 [Acidimicrobiales bacterium]
MAAVQLWCRVTVVGVDGAELARCVLEGAGAPDLSAVDAVARLALAAGRLGGGVVLTELSPDLRALLELAGLRPGVAGLRVEVEGQTEFREEPFGVQEGQEEGHPRDLPF